MATKRFLKSLDECKRVEMRFAPLKMHHGFERMRLQGLSSTREHYGWRAAVAGSGVCASFMIASNPPKRNGSRSRIVNPRLAMR